MHSWASHRRISYRVALLQADFSQTVIDTAFKALMFLKLKLISSECLCTSMFLFHSATPVSTRTGITVILMTDCGLGRVNIRKSDRKTHWGEVFQLQLQDNFRPAEKMVCTCELLRHILFCTINSWLKTKKPWVGQWNCASSSKIRHNKYEKKAIILENIAFFLL